MSHISRQYSAASSLVTISSQPYYQTQLSAGTFGRYHSPLMNYNTMTAIPASPSTARLGGRKRSRDEALTNLEPIFNPTVADDSPPDGTYGNGMASIQPANGHIKDANNQSGTWTQRKLDEDQSAKQAVETDEPELRSHKAQRLDCTIGTASRCSTQHQPASKPSPGDIPSALCNDALVIDKFTVHLGIGWRSISSDEHIQAAARGWARFIENNFGLAGVRICLESKGLQSYLVKASNGYFLFTENLRQGRLVSSTADGALQNLQLSPPRFEGPVLDLMAKDNERVDAFADSAMVLDS